MYGICPAKTELRVKEIESEFTLTVLNCIVYAECDALNCFVTGLNHVNIENPTFDLGWSKLQI